MTGTSRAAVRGGDVADAVADQIDGQHQQEQGDARNGDEPGFEEQVGAPSATIRPQDGSGGCTPSPRNDSAASSRMATVVQKLA
ncbi:hypothetical protein [Azospirillum brasilense]|uniref:hypothetical protein n=1 Tax=Azospirillum brasilense TaxID=192 RepID=UPI0014782244